MEEQLISVIIPAYNRREALPACIESVLAQSWRNLEVLVVDDGSTDGTEELFAEYPDERVRYLRYETNRGACHARNYGAARVRGELVAFQDSDDLWYPDKLRKQYELLMGSGAELCFCGMDRVSAGGSRYYFPVHPFHPEHGLEEFLAENRAGTQTLLMYRRVWEELKFDEEIRRYQDWDFGIRAAADYRLVYLPEALVRSEVGADSISARVASYPHLLRLYRKHKTLYERYPKSAAVMHRRMGKRLRDTDPKTAAAHFKTGFLLSHNPYDLGWWIADTIRMAAGRRERKVFQ